MVLISFNYHYMPPNSYSVMYFGMETNFKHQSYDQTFEDDPKSIIRGLYLSFWTWETCSQHSFYHSSTIDDPRSTFKGTKRSVKLQDSQIKVAFIFSNANLLNYTKTIFSINQM